MAVPSKPSPLNRLWGNLTGATAATDIRPFTSLLERINLLGDSLGALEDQTLFRRAEGLHAQAEGPLVSDDLLCETFALVREVACRTLAQRPYDEQMIAGIAMHRGRVVEMQTGEGKTLAAVAPVVLNALTGSGAHVLTANDYLARRDASWMSPIYEVFNLDVGSIQEGMTVEAKRRAYACDVTYLTAREAGFDFLRERLCLDGEQRIQQRTAFALVDEADSILVDEARIPLVIAGACTEPADGLAAMADLVRRLTQDVDFDTDEHGHNIFLTDQGSARVEEIVGLENLYAPDNQAFLAHLRNALHAENLIHRDVDYIVRGGAIELVDDFTGRVADRRQWPDGLQAAIEAKEALRPGDEGQVLGSITMQHFLTTYDRLCGMTATARPATEELESYYGLEVTVVGFHQPCRRVDHVDRVFTHKRAKRRALVREIAGVHDAGRPILVGTASVAESEELAAKLADAGVSCQVLNAKNDELEAEIIADAGAVGAVTISTNMAGRGTDIRLGGASETDREEVVALGGLYVIGTNRHESLRIDQQLRGRAGRQGDPGASRFFTSLTDPLISRYGVRNLVAPRYLPKEQEEPIESAVLRREIDRAQRIIEGENITVRRRLWDYTNLVETQRQHIQSWRQNILDGLIPLNLISEHRPKRTKTVRALVGDEGLSLIERRLTLIAIDRAWSDHLEEVGRIRDGIHVVGVAGKNPLAEFWREAGEAFGRLRPEIDSRVVELFDRITVTEKGVDWQREGLLGPSSTWTYQVNDSPFGANPMQDLANRAGFAFWGAILLGPVIFLWGLWMHWKRWRRGR